jgi:hypothetical protein
VESHVYQIQNTQLKAIPVLASVTIKLRLKYRNIGTRLAFLVTKTAQKPNHPLPGLLMTNPGLILISDFKGHT